MSVAVISNDPDFKEACERFPGLMFFPSLVAYSESLQSSDERLASIQGALANDSEIIRSAINEAFVDSEFTIEANWDGEVSDVEITGADRLDFHVVGIGEDRCTVAFEGEIEYSAKQFLAASAKGTPAALAEWTAEESAVSLAALRADPLLPSELLSKHYLGRKIWQKRRKLLAAAARVPGRITHQPSGPREV